MKMPAAAQRYFDAVAAKNGGGVRYVLCPRPVVIDVGRQIRGREAITAWARSDRPCLPRP